MKFSKNISKNMLILFFVVAIGLFIWMYYSNKLHEGARSKCYDNAPYKCENRIKGEVYSDCKGKVYKCNGSSWIKA